MLLLRVKERERERASDGFSIPVKEIFIMCIGHYGNYVKRQCVFAFRFLC